MCHHRPRIYEALTPKAIFHCDETVRFVIMDGTIGLPESKWVTRVLLDQPEVEVKSNITRHEVNPAIYTASFTLSSTIKQLRAS